MTAEEIIKEAIAKKARGEITYDEYRALYDEYCAKAKAERLAKKAS